MKYHMYFFPIFQALDCCSIRILCKCNNCTLCVLCTLCCVLFAQVCWCAVCCVLCAVCCVLCAVCCVLCVVCCVLCAAVVSKNQSKNERKERELRKKRSRLGYCTVGVGNRSDHVTHFLSALSITICNILIPAISLLKSSTSALSDFFSTGLGSTSFCKQQTRVSPAFLV